MAASAAARRPRGAGVERLAVDAGDDAAGGLGDGDGSGEVDVVAQVALVEVRRPASGREPGHRERRGADARAELAVEGRMPEETQGLAAVGMVEVHVDQQRGGRRPKGVSAPARRTKAAEPSVQNTSPVIGSALAAAHGRASGAQGDVDGDQRRLRGEVAGPAQRVDQPLAGRARRDPCGRPPRRPSRRRAGARPAPPGSPPPTPGRRTSRSRCPPWRGAPAGRRTGSRTSAAPAGGCNGELGDRTASGPRVSMAVAREPERSQRLAGAARHS